MTARALLATSILFLLSLTTIQAAERADDLPTATVLCYHIVESPQDPRMEISRDTFRQQMHYLAMTGYSVITLHDLYDYVAGKKASIPKNSVVITIDDGWRSTYTEAYPELKKRHFPFTVFVYPKIIGQTSLALTWKQVKEMADNGVDIQSHSLSHPFLTQRRHSALDQKAYADWLSNELVESRRILEKETGRSVAFLAYPYGDYDSRVAAVAAKSGYAAALTCDFGPVRRGSDPLRMRRVVIDKRMDFATFRRYLGAGRLPLEEITPKPGQVFDPGQPVITARIPNFKNLDPKSIGAALMNVMGTTPFSYDPHDGSISLTLKDVKDSLKGKYQRVLLWATDLKTGKRVEASWTFKLPEPPAPAAQPALDAPLPTVTPIGAGEATTAAAMVTPPVAAETPQPAAAKATEVPPVVTPSGSAPAATPAGGAVKRGDLSEAHGGVVQRAAAKP